MASYNPVPYREVGPEHDHEHWPLGHYRGRGNRQDHTGPSGPWLERTGAPYVRPPPTGPVHFANRPKRRLRSDRRILDEVHELLADHGDIDASDIRVVVDDGDVILRGTVRSRWARFYAEDLVMMIGGVRDVVNELRIARTPDGRELTGPTSDTGGTRVPIRHYP